MSFLSVSPSVRSSAWNKLRSPWTDVHEILYLNIFFENLSGELVFL